MRSRPVRNLQILLLLFTDSICRSFNSWWPWHDGIIFLIELFNIVKIAKIVSDTVETKLLRMMYKKRGSLAVVARAFNSSTLFQKSNQINKVSDY